MKPLVRWMGVLAVAVVLASSARPVPARAGSVGTFVLTAKKIDFYTNLFIMRADGDVRIDLGTGTVLHGTSFAMDVRNSRFVLTGSVRIEGFGPAGAPVAIAEDLVADRAYLLTVDPSGPHFLTYASSAFRGAQTATPPPESAFAVTNVTGVPASFHARGVVVGAGSFMRFSGCRAQVVGGTSLYVPLPACYINFGSDPNLAQNSLAGANVGAGYRFTGSANATSAVIVNYDAANKVYGALQENVSSQNAWAVASVYPLGQKDLVYSAIAAAQIPDRAGLRVSGQYHTQTTTATDPYGSYSYADALITAALPGAYAQLFTSFGNQGVSDAGAAAGIVAPQQSNTQLAVSSSDIRLGTSPLIANIRGGYGQVHNPSGLQTFGGVAYSTVWSDYAGVALRAPHLALGHSQNPQAAFYIDISAGYERQWNSLPHVIDQTTTSISLSRSFGRFSSYAAYSIQNVGDNYGSAQRLAYPAITTSDPGYDAFDGFATFRTLALEIAYTPKPDLAITLTGLHHVDFPKPDPSVFATPATPSLGENPQPYILGQPPYDITGTARFRINPQLSFDVQETYYFNFGGRTFTGAEIQVRP
jgi:hypothetical protein